MLNNMAVNQNKNDNIVKFVIYKNDKIICETFAYIGKNGLTKNKQEGDQKTPIGKFSLGTIFGIHTKKNSHITSDINYIQINSNLYWVDDVKSIYYNQLVNIQDVRKDWKSAEHLVQYPEQYEYAIEIKSNPQNIRGKRECNIFTLQYRKTNNGLCCN